MNWRTWYVGAVSFSISMLLIAGLTIIPWLSHADSGTVLKVAQFSAAPEGTAVPSGWKPLTFSKIPRHTRYTVVREGDATVVKATSEAAASGLTHEVKIDLKEYPILRWRWKVNNVITKSDVHTKEGDDYAARIYITFEYDPDKVGFLKKAKYKAGRLLLGDIPIAAINYIWESKVPKGTIVDNAYTDFVKMIVVESGNREVGRWKDEERNVYEDYKNAFGDEPPRVNGVAIMTDADNTGESVTAYYGDIAFMKAR